MKMIVATLLLLASGVPLGSSAQGPGLGGVWEGALVREGEELAISVEFKVGPTTITGTVDSADAGALRIPLASIVYEAPTVRFQLPTNAGLLACEGELRGDDIVGSAKLGPATATFYLKRASVRPRPYREEEVRFQSDQVTLAGTLLLPLGPGPVPAVVMVPSSGAATRDSSRFMAAQFATRGIAALIYDKRGTGASTGDWWTASFDMLATDALHAVGFLQARRDIDARRIGLRGQSQGARIAGIAAARAKDVAFLMLVAAGGLNPEQQELRRVESEMRQKQLSDEDIAKATALMKAKFHFARTREGWDGYYTAVVAAKDQKWFPTVLAPERADDQSFALWHLINDDEPVNAWRHITCPTLGVLGELDTNTPVSETAQLLTRTLDAAGSHDVTVRIFPNADHTLFVTPQSGASKWPRLAPGYLAAQLDWAVSRVSAKR